MTYTVRFPLSARLLLLAPLLVAAPTQAQEQWDPEAIIASKDFVSPPSSILDAILAPRYLNASLTQVSPDKRWFIHEVGDGPVTMDRFSKPFDELGGVFIDYQANRHRDLTIRTNVGINVISATDGSVVEVDVPDGARVSNASWSPDGSALAFFVHTPTETHIWVADPSSGNSRQVTRTPVLATLVTDFEWTSDGREIATILIPEGRTPRPQESRIPAGPQVKQTEDGENMLRTYASLMATPYDELLLEWHATGQLAAVDVDSRSVTEIGDPDMISSLDFAPDGRFVRVELTQKPFSYVVPVRNFGRVEQIWDRSGAMLAELDVTEMNTGLGDDRPAAPGVGGNAGEEERRQVAWREDGSGLTFIEAIPAPEGEEDDARGDANRPPRADRVMLWAAPFDEGSLSVVYQSPSRISSHRFSPDHRTLFVTERPGANGFGGGGRGSARGTVREYAVDLSDPSETFTLAQYESDDFYANPGSLLLEGGSVPPGGRGGFGGGDNGGGEVVQTSADGRHVFFYGHEYNEDPMVESPKNFLDRVEIRTGERERMYESSNEGQYERIVSVLDVDAGTFVVSRETPVEIGQAYRYEDGRRTRLTNNIDYTPDITAAPRQRFVVERPDGFRFLVNVTLPTGHTPGERLPAMFWFYPREYTDQESYDESGRTYNLNAFPNFGRARWSTSFEPATRSWSPTLRSWARKVG